MVIKSMPTRDTRTHASITMPLSSTRSSTSTTLVPFDGRSRGMCWGLARTRARAAPLVEGECRRAFVGGRPDFTHRALRFGEQQGAQAVAPFVLDTRMKDVQPDAVYDRHTGLLHDFDTHHGLTRCV